VERPVTVNRLLSDGDRIGIGGERSLGIIHTPGHSPGSLSLFLEDEGVLFSGNAVPVKGELSVYDDPVASLRSLGRLRGLEGIRVLLSSWDRPKAGEEARRTMADGKEVIRALHAAVVQAAGKEADPAGIAGRVVEDLGLPGAASPVITRTVSGHIRAMEKGMDTGPGSALFR
jgi:glyoxylase-like metal-dependent hydrolase (beta-lactamase superfamily II)